MRVVIFVPSNVHSLELAGLMDVFAEVNARAEQTFYEVAVVADEGRPIVCGSGLRVLPDSTYRAILTGPDMGCLIGQGYLFGRPADEENFLSALRKAASPADGEAAQRAGLPSVDQTHRHTR